MTFHVNLLYFSKSKIQCGLLQMLLATLLGTNYNVQCGLKFSILHSIFLIFYAFHKIHSRMGNSTDPNLNAMEQSDLGLHCFAFTIFHNSWCKTF